MDEQMIEPCPFCGTAPHLEANGAMKGGQIVVADCGRGCPCARMYAETDAWNRRAAHSVMAGKVAELEGALRKIASQACCYGMSAGEDELRDWIKAISDEAEAALAPYPERRSE